MLSVSGVRLTNEAQQDPTLAEEAANYLDKLIDAVSSEAKTRCYKNASCCKSHFMGTQPCSRSYVFTLRGDLLATNAADLSTPGIPFLC